MKKKTSETPRPRGRVNKKTLELALENAQIAIDAERDAHHKLQRDFEKLCEERRALLADVDAARLSEGILRTRLNDISAAAINKLLDIASLNRGNGVVATALRSVG